MAMSVIPGSRSSPGFCHNRRQGNRSAQKQIICPIYRAPPAGRPYRMGHTQKKSSRKAPGSTPQIMKVSSFFKKERICSLVEGLKSDGIWLVFSRLRLFSDHFANCGFTRRHKPAKASSLPQMS